MSITRHKQYATYEYGSFEKASIQSTIKYILPLIYVCTFDILLRTAISEEDKRSNRLRFFSIYFEKKELHEVERKKLERNVLNEFGFITPFVRLSVCLFSV